LRFDHVCTMASVRFSFFFLCVCVFCHQLHYGMPPAAFVLYGWNDSSERFVQSQVLSSKYDGSFANVIARAGNSAQRLLQIIVGMRAYVTVNCWNGLIRLVDMSLIMADLRCWCGRPNFGVLIIACWRASAPTRNCDLLSLASKKAQSCGAKSLSVCFDGNRTLAYPNLY
jgi:hypothetical protein